MGVSKLIIGGFKSIRDRTEIRLAPLTFLFGPNSAGKSAVLLAVDELREKLAASPTTHASDLVSLVRLLTSNPHEHRPGPSPDSDEPASSVLSLGVEVDAFPIERTNFDGRVDEARDMALELFKSLDDRRVEVELTQAGLQFVGKVSVDDSSLLEFWESSLYREASLPGNDSKVASSNTWAPSWWNKAIDRWDALKINLAHPLWKASRFAMRLAALQRLARTAESPLVRQALQLDDETLIVRTPVSTLHASGWGDQSQFEQSLRDLAHSSGVGDGAIPSAERSKWRKNIALVDSVCSTVSFLVEQIRFVCDRELELAVVPGDRGVLQAAQVATEVSLSNYRWSVGRGPKVTDYAAWLGTLRAGRELLPKEAFDNVTAIDDFVNDALRADLFPSQRYQVAPQVSRLVVEGLIERNADESSNEELLKVALYLEDAVGRDLDFDQVGSGVSYVLPVLVSLWGADRSWIEQPELHLHPAAQCELGDLFIRALYRGRFSIVETHSEHILLRVLRRIRQTAAGVALDDELKCHPETVSVLYFEPKGDGSTAIRQLRVTRGGDFMDRWPSGFFEERDRELFDE